MGQQDLHIDAHIGAPWGQKEPKMGLGGSTWSSRVACKDHMPSIGI